jgi:hypothetical protein
MRRGQVGGRTRNKCLNICFGLIDGVYYDCLTCHQTISSSVRVAVLVALR